MNSIICPISTKKINSHESRLTVFICVIFMFVFVLTRNPLFMIIATFDTMIRAMLPAKYSLIKKISSLILQVSNWEVKKIDLAKKIFASRLGMLCGVASVILFYLNMELASLIIAGFWMLLAILDSVFDFCMGCIIYSYVVFPYYKNRYTK